MSYQVLARKWRPQLFEDVIGQEHITESLKQSITTGRLHHGYIFSGIRGIGKTTTARIFAKALNCVHGPTIAPCNHCEFCREITAGYSMDVEEIDGASHRGVDEVRVLQEDVSYAPSRSRYKIFIIDEVHSLTKEAFNALLKTLEEPPPRMLFIMATTEPWKIPMTIHSRCQLFKFRNGTSAQLVALLQRLATHEQVQISSGSLALIAKTSGGSVRDAENLFDQVIGFGGNVIQDGDVRYVLGIPDRELLNACLSAIFAHQTAKIFTLIEQLVSKGYHLRYFCMELMERIRHLIVLKAAKQPDAYLSLFDYSRADLEQFASQTTLPTLQQMYWYLVQAERDIRFSPNPRFILEMAVTKIADMPVIEPFDDIQRQLTSFQSAIEHAQTITPSHTAIPKSSSPSAREEIPVAPISQLLSLWNNVLQQVKQVRPSLAPSLQHASPVQLTERELMLGFKDADFSKQTIEKPKNLELLAAILKESLGRTIRVVTTIHDSAASLTDIRQKLEQNIAARPAPEIKPVEIKTAAPPEKRKPQGERIWQKRSQPQNQYKPPTQVTVNDIVKLFEGAIEE